MLQNLLLGLAILGLQDSALQQVQATLPKILCLHGGGMTASSFENMQGMQDLMSGLSSNYEFVFAQGQYSQGWIPDPAGGKGAPSTDPNYAENSVTYLDSLIATQGPFAGILGYSQGAAFAGYYLHKQTSASSPFQFAMLFCGYLPTTHQGLLATLNSASPFHGIPAMVFMGANDFIISNTMTNDQAAKFTNPTVITSTSAGHELPPSSDSKFAMVRDFAIAQLSSSGGNGQSNSPTPAAQVTTTTPVATSGATTTTVLISKSSNGLGKSQTKIMVALTGLLGMVVLPFLLGQ